MFATTQSERTPHWSRLLRLAIVAIVALTSLASQALLAAAQPDSADPRFDLTSDGRVTYADVMEVVLSWIALDAQGASCAAPLPAPAHDLDGDGCITVLDVQLISARTGGVTNVARASAFEGAINALAGEPVTLVVDSTGDAVDSDPGNGACGTSGNGCTLRAAVVEANARPGPENIHFNIPGSGVREIRLNSDLPTISDQTSAVVIDGFTQPGSQPNTNTLAQGSNAVIRIQIAGNSNQGPSAFRISSSNNVIRGLALYNMWRKVWIAGSQADNNVISGNYIIRYATPSNGRSVRLELDDVAIGGPILLPNSGGYQVWASATTEPIELPAGNYTLKLVLNSTNINLNFIEATPAGAPPPPPDPTVPDLPGTIEAEGYNAGGEGVGYHDLTSGNTGNLFRSDDVYIEACSDPTSGQPCYDVGWTETGEWLAYDVNVPAAGYYVFTIRYATPSTTPRRVRIEIDGVDATGPIDLPSTGGYKVWGNASSIPVAIPAGVHTIKLVFDRGGPNLNYISVTAQ